MLIIENLLLELLLTLPTNLMRLDTGKLIMINSIMTK